MGFACLILGMFSSHMIWWFDMICSLKGLGSATCASYRWQCPKRGPSNYLKGWRGSIDPVSQLLLHRTNMKKWWNTNKDIKKSHTFPRRNGLLPPFWSFLYLFLPSQSVRNIWMQHGKEIIPPNIDIVGPAGDRVGAAQAWRMRRISRMRIWNAKMPSNQELNHHQKRCHFSRQIRTVSSVFLVSKLTGLGHWPGDD